MISRLKLKILKRFSNEFDSKYLRAYFDCNYNIEVGLYSYGCFDRSRFDPNTIIGRYCSFSPTCRILNRNHGIEHVSTTPYLYNSSLGLVETEINVYQQCTVMDDVWVGHNAIILPSCRQIGRGAIIAAGAIVSKNVPAYSIVAGVPAKVISYRFDPATIERVENSKWWNWDLETFSSKLKSDPDFFYRPQEDRVTCAI